MSNPPQQTWDIILDSRLVEIYEIDEATLKRNRQGRMTEKQAQRLRKMRFHKMRHYGMTGILAFVLWLGLGFIALAGFLGALLWMFRFLLLGIVLLQIGRVTHHYWRTGREISSAKVLMYPGRLDKIVWYGIRIMFCERGTFYHLPDEEWNAFDHYQRYRVYCTPYTHIIVGAQPVHRDEPLPEAWANRHDRF